MKRLWFAIIFLIIAIISCSYEQVVIRLGYKEITSVIDKAVVSAQLNEKIKYCNDASQLWDRYEKKIAPITDHSNFDEADVCINQIKAYADKGDIDKENLDEALLEAKSQLERTYNSSKINLSNIF